MPSGPRRSPHPGEPSQAPRQQQPPPPLPAPVMVPSSLPAAGPSTTAAPLPAVLVKTLPSLSPPPVSEAAMAKLTRGHSCVLCQQRKVRCDKNKPCANCVKARVECRVVPPQPPRRRKKKPQERELVERLRRYESLLSQHGVTFEPLPLPSPSPTLPGGPSGSSGPAGAAAAGQKASPSSISGNGRLQVGRTGGDGPDDMDDLQHDLGGLRTSPSPSSGEHGYRGESSDEELEGTTTIHHAFDTMYANEDGFPFMVGGTAGPVTDYHPTGVQIFQLWQAYLTNVNPLLKITHTPTLQAQVIEAGAHVGHIPRGLEALMFSIYLAAVTSMSDQEVEHIFREDRARLLSRFHRATQQALINAGFMRSADLVVLQAYFLFLVCLTPISLPTSQPSPGGWRQYVDPRSLFCLIGIAVRIAQRMGLHRDGANHFGLPPHEAEMRRRLWWQIVVFDKRIAEITGAGITALSVQGIDTHFPLNVNDTDLHLHAKEPPKPYPGPTEMLFCLARIELCTAASADRPRPPTVGATGNSPGTPGSASTATHSTGGGTTATRKFHYSPSPNSPDLFTHMANQTLPDDTENFCQYIENTYLAACNSNIPLQRFTLLMTRQAICKLRIVHFLTRTAGGIGGHGPMAPMGSAMGGGGGGGSVPGRTMGASGTAVGSVPAGVQVENSERDALFIEAIHMLEYDNLMQKTESLQGFIWYTYMHLPLPAYMFLAMELRSRLHTGELADRAWQVMAENNELRGLTNNSLNPIHIATGSLLVRAWDTHEAVEQQLGRPVPEPLQFIHALRQTVPKSRNNSADGPRMGGVVPQPSPPSQQQQPQQQQQQQQHHQQRPQQQSQSQQQPQQQSQQQQHHHQNDRHHYHHQSQHMQPPAVMVTRGPSGQEVVMGDSPMQQAPPALYQEPASDMAPPGSGAFEGLVPLQGAGVPEVMDLGAVDWSWFVQGEYGAYNSSFGPIYGHPGGQQ